LVEVLVLVSLLWSCHLAMHSLLGIKQNIVGFAKVAGA
jgi:hypothetical protein